MVRIEGLPQLVYGSRTSLPRACPLRLISSAVRHWSSGKVWALDRSEPDGRASAADQQRLVCRHAEVLDAAVGGLDRHRQRSRLDEIETIGSGARVTTAEIAARAGVTERTYFRFALTGHGPGRRAVPRRASALADPGGELPEAVGGG
jgi:hypothetical protein